MKTSSILKKSKRIWRSKFQIINGLINYITEDMFAAKVSIDRMHFCLHCEHYDENGTSELAIGNGGGESCDICGCLLQVKTRCLECECALSELGREPLWKEVKE